MAVSRRLRYEILRRDNHQCRYCGAAAPDVKLTVDHVLPVALGGTDAATNLVAACNACNSGKSATTPDAPLVEDVSQDQARWGRAMAVAIEQRAAELAADRQRLAWFDRQWQDWNSNGVELPREGDWKASVLRFMAAGLDDQFLLDAIEIAAGNPKIRNGDVWRYFCGICWREIEALQKRAAQNLADTEPTMTFQPVFPYADLADTYIGDLLRAVGKGDWVPLASRTFWGALQEAHNEFMQGPGVWESEEDRAMEMFSNWTAHTVHTIEQARAGERVPDGS